MITDQKEIQKRISWSASRKIIEKSIVRLQSNITSERYRALEVLHEVGKLAIARHKDSSTRQILTELTDRLLRREEDLDMCVQIADILANLIRRVIEMGKLKLAGIVVESFRNMLEELKQVDEKSEELEFRLETIHRMFENIAQENTVRYLVDQMERSRKRIADRSIKILGALRTETVALNLLKVFEYSSRRVRGRAYTLLVNMPATAGEMMAWKLGFLHDREIFPRSPGSRASLVAEAWYQARNALGVLAEVWYDKAYIIFKNASKDPDTRVRKEVLAALAKANRPEVNEIAKQLLQDEDEKVRTMAIMALSSAAGSIAESELIELFYLYPEHREDILETLIRVRSETASDFLFESLRLKDKNSRVIYLADPDLHQVAISCLGKIGCENDLVELKQFHKRLGNPFSYIFHYPIGWVFRAGKIRTTVQETIIKLETVLKSAA